MPHGENDTSFALDFTGEQCVEFSLRPSVFKKIRTQHHNPEPRQSNSILDASPEIVSKPKFELVQPDPESLLVQGSGQRYGNVGLVFSRVTDKDVELGYRHARPMRQDARNALRAHK